MTNKQLIREKKNDKGEIFREFSLRDEHSYMIGLNNGIEKGKLEQKKEDIKLINNLKNPYPRDVFTEPSKEQWDKLQILFEDNNLTQDRYFGSFGRLVFNNIIKQLKKEIGGMK